VDSRAQVERLKINTWVGDLMYDHRSRSEGALPLISIQSHHNILPEIAHLYTLTGIQKISHEKLVRLFEKQLGIFPPPLLREER
jgi:hypothetical protein